MSQDLVKALGVTPAEKKASELAEKYAAKQNHTIVSALISEADFKAGFLAALELAEVRGLEDALNKTVKPKYGLQGYIEEEDLEGERNYLTGMVSYYEGIAREALTAWRSFRGEK